MTRTERIDRILQQTIEGDNLDVLMTGLSGADQNLFYDLIAELRAGGDLDLEDLWKIDYTRRPPTMEEFLDDSYWLGDIAKHTDENQGIFPAWKKILCDDFNLDSRLHNVVITGSLGVGKSWCSAAIICYRVVLCRLLRNPYGFLGLSKGSPVVFALLSVTKAAVHDTIFGDVMNFMAHSPFFTEECKFDIEKKYSNLKIPLGNDVVLTAGSQGQHVLGRNTLAVAMDEGNWRREANPDEKAYKLYDDIRQRITNRFQKIAGFLPAVCLLASSARDESSFTEQVITDINLAADQRTQKVYRLAAFEVKRHLLTLKPRWFKVAFGLKTTAPRILKGWYREDGTTVEAGDDAPPGARVRLVPEDYLPDFKRNVTTSLQSICGESTGGAFRLFSDFSIMEMAVTAADAVGLKNPCTIDQVPLSNDDAKEMWDYLEPHSNFVQRQLGRFLPKRDPGQPRYVHYDLATVNQAGLAICHVAGRKLVDGLYDASSGKVFAQYRPVIEYDFILAVVPGEQKEISLIKIQNFLFWLRDRCGYSFGLVTADSFQCVDGDTPVNTSRGIIPMIDVRIGDAVNSRDGPRPVVGKISYKGVPKLKLTGYDGETLIGTPNHRVWASKSNGKDLSKQKLAWGWIQLDQLQPGDALAMSYSWVEAANEVKLPKLPGVLAGSCNPRQNSNWPVPSMLTEEMAEVLGLFWGDGCTSGNNISICSSEADFQDLLAAWTRLGWPVSTVSRRGCPIVHSNSPRLARWWKACGFTKSPQKGKQPGKEVGLPEAILRSPKRVQAAFLRGLFSADGSVDQCGGVSLSTKHKKLAELVQMLLRTGWAIPSHITSLKRPFKKGGRLFKGYILSLRGCRVEFCNQIGFCYKTKQDKLVGKLHHKGRKLYSTVKSVERVEDGDVYDIQVEGDPSYVSNGFMSHNSQMPLELLSTHGFEVDLLSMDRTKDPYYSWRNGFSENLIRMFRHPILMHEAEQLQDLQKKIDHPTPGTKDVADACAGAYFNALRLGLGSVGTDSAIPDFWAEKGMLAEKPPIEMRGPDDKIPVHTFEG